MTIDTLKLCTLLAADIERRHTFDTLALCERIVATCETERAAWASHIEAIVMEPV